MATPAARGSVRAVASNFDITSCAVGLTDPDLRRLSHQSAATPATCGQAMLVPLSVRKPPPTLTDRILNPGAATCGNVLEKNAILYFPSACCSAPTDMTPSAAAGSDAAIL